MDKLNYENEYDKPMVYKIMDWIVHIIGWSVALVLQWLTVKIIIWKCLGKKDREPDDSIPLIVQSRLVESTRQTRVNPDLLT